MRLWYRFTAKGETVTDLSIFDEIGAFGVSARQFIADLKQVKTPTIALSINSPGGSVFDALAIFNALRMSGKRIEVTVLGIAASAASYIMLAGDRITMPENAMVMVHNPMGGLFGNADEHRELAAILDKVGENLQATYASRTGMTPEAVAELLSKDNFLTAAECLELGLVDEVTPALALAASFVTENLPPNVQALFKAVNGTPEPEGDDDEDDEGEGDDEDEDEDEDDEVDPEALTPEQIAARVTEAGFGEFASRWALEASLAQPMFLDAVIAQAGLIRSLCAVAKQEDKAAQFITARTPIAEVRSALTEALADADQHVSATVPAAGAAAPVQSTKAATTTRAIWAKRNSLEQKQ
jgi:ATP-dependent Clp protease protease subunit